MRFHIPSISTPQVVAISTKTISLSKRLSKFAKSIKAGLASVRSRRSTPPKFQSKASYEDFYAVHFPDPFEDGSSDIDFEKPKAPIHPLGASASAILTAHCHVSDCNGSDIFARSIPDGDVLSESNTSPVAQVPLDKLDGTKKDGEHTPIAPNEDTVIQDEAEAKEQEEEARAKALLREDIQSRWFAKKSMDEESYQKIAKLHETAILPQVQKYSTSYGLHGPTRFGDDPQTNGLSYGKWLAAPKEKPTIVDRHPVARISPSAAMLAPLYDILASLEEQVAREIAESNEDVSYERPSCVPAVRGRRSVHHRMATDF